MRTHTHTHTHRLDRLVHAAHGRTQRIKLDHVVQHAVPEGLHGQQCLTVNLLHQPRARQGQGIREGEVEGVGGSAKTLQCLSHGGGYTIWGGVIRYALLGHRLAS